MLRLFALTLVILCSYHCVSANNDNAVESAWEAQFRDFCPLGDYCDDEKDCEYGENLQGACCNYACSAPTILKRGDTCDPDDTCKGICPDGAECDGDTYTCPTVAAIGCTCADDEDCGGGEDTQCFGYKCVTINQMNGAACSGYYECASGNCANSVCTGLAYGAECEDNRDQMASVCQDGLYCADKACAYRGLEGAYCNGGNDNWDECVDGYFCLNNVCVERYAQGVQCAADDDDENNRRKDEEMVNPCKDGLLCHLQYCVPRKSVATGQECANPFACATGFCPGWINGEQQDDNGDDVKYTCQAAASLASYAACYNDYQCPDYSMCQDGACTASMMGVACAEDDNGRRKDEDVCGPGLMCGCENVCVADTAVQITDSCSANVGDLLYYLQASNPEDDKGMEFGEGLDPGSLTGFAKSAFIAWRCCVGCGGQRDVYTHAFDSFKLPLGIYSSLAGDNRRNNDDAEAAYIPVLGGYTYDCYALEMSPVTAAGGCNADPGVAMAACYTDAPPTPSQSPTDVPTMNPTWAPTSKATPLSGQSPSSAVGVVVAVLLAACCCCLLLRSKRNKKTHVPLARNLHTQATDGATYATYAESAKRAFQRYDQSASPLDGPEMSVF
eukprot:CAMPEP_0205821500 /NCGR_PEP_ID=MMETSP0206-20130828/8088_1 /ASSEMBLY_ACC=CAM_ASM_000279 /TAXON_ID=36767 /ORGANISM="Euplotes focardii, Strain TN1" /LENGTH=615 /DNA_ID=CAMNT_0053117021 /DNA_START=21 /DNA_END=1868 /DNA_ORIENTATION=-